MAHPEQKVFCLQIMSLHPEFFMHRNVLDVGSLDINGNNRYLFTESTYCGIDIGAGPNVDIVTIGHEFAANDSAYDFIVSTECFEHDMHYAKTLHNIVRMLASGGMFLFTCATTDRPEHGTLRTSPGNAPLLSAHGEWENYYKNLTEVDIREVLDIEMIFSEYRFEVNNQSHDLYFYGIKR